MTIGKMHDIEGFRAMHELKEKVIKDFNLESDKFILSMGTSADYLDAITEGSNEVRVGTTIFGERDYSKK